MTADLIPFFVIVPLLAAGVLVLAGNSQRIGKAGLLAVLGADVVWAVWLLTTLLDGDTVLAHRIGLWPTGVAIPFAADLFTALMLTVTGFVTLVTCWFGVVSGQAEKRYFGPLVLVLTAGFNGALLTADLFNLFVFIEVMLLPSYALIILAHRGRGRLMQVTSSRIYVSVNLLASTIFLAGVGLVYGTAGTVNVGELAGRAAESTAVAVSVAVVLSALAVKAAVVPVHGWLARTYPFMSPTVTALFSGLHTKVAVYAIYRIYAVIFDGMAQYLWIGVVVFSASMVIGVLGAVGERDARAILAHSTVSQIGYILLGVALFGAVGLTAGIFYLLHHTVVKVSLFLSTGAVEIAYGRQPLGEVTGLLRREPLTAVVFFAAAMSLTGIPPFSGFVAKLALILAAFEEQQVAVALVAVAVSLFTLLYSLKIWGRMFLGEPENSSSEVVTAVGTKERRIPVGLIAPALVLAVVTLALGVGGELLLGVSATAAEGLVDTSAFVEAVTSS
ncbi:monovalent cation/H+ antiporter subunit D family protein [Kocuria sp. SM24M-10]|uniref:monovalent cation/H+ antiporter subunit D family protein n=1 Tax=Kocuria sp. SM24M-10 TaxID=1660349 RepID=UPI00064ADA67|nr:monovalent cation/H+ antiporter subunit D family protein [Kocuria sp. SM24M-10]KLU08173.1 cation:proton antiporter [Kocuria sp. SM24M-10]